MDALKSFFSLKRTCWLLIATMLLVTLLPAHYHLHHLYDDDVDGAVTGSTPATHAHVMDFHLLTNTDAQSHHDEGATSIAASPDTVVKKSNPLLTPLILMAVILALLSILNRQFTQLRGHKNTDFIKHYLYFSPLLRAPPIH